MVCLVLLLVSVLRSHLLILDEPESMSRLLLPLGLREPLALIDPLAVDVHRNLQGVDLHLVGYLADSAFEGGFLHGSLELDLDGLGV